MRYTHVASRLVCQFDPSKKEGKRGIGFDLIDTVVYPICPVNLQARMLRSFVKRETAGGAWNRQRYSTLPIPFARMNHPQNGYRIIWGIFVRERADTWVCVYMYRESRTAVGCYFRFFLSLFQSG